MPGLFDRGLPVGGLGDDRHVRLGVKDDAERAADVLLIIGDQNAGRLADHGVTGNAILRTGHSCEGEHQEQR
jgi:hypothetical protein